MVYLCGNNQSLGVHSKYGPGYHVQEFEDLYIADLEAQRQLLTRGSKCFVFAVGPDGKPDPVAEWSRQ